MAAGHDNDLRRMQFFPERPANLKAAHFRQQEIADDRLGFLGKGDLHPLHAVVRFEHVPLVAREKPADAFAAFRIIFDEQDCRHGR